MLHLDDCHVVEFLVLDIVQSVLLFLLGIGLGVLLRFASVLYLIVFLFVGVVDGVAFILANLFLGFALRLALEVGLANLFHVGPLLLARVFPVSPSVLPG